MSFKFQLSVEQAAFQINFCAVMQWLRSNFETVRMFALAEHFSNLFYSRRNLFWWCPGSKSIPRLLATREEVTPSLWHLKSRLSANFSLFKLFRPYWEMNLLKFVKNWNLVWKYRWFFWSTYYKLWRILVDLRPLGGWMSYRNQPFQRSSGNINYRRKLFRQKLFFIKFYTSRKISFFFVTAPQSALNRGLKMILHFAIHLHRPWWGRHRFFVIFLVSPSSVTEGVQITPGLFSLHSRLSLLDFFLPISLRYAGFLSFAWKKYWVQTAAWTFEIKKQKYVLRKRVQSWCIWVSIFGKRKVSYSKRNQTLSFEDPFFGLM